VRLALRRVSQDGNFKSKHELVLLQNQSYWSWLGQKHSFYLQVRTCKRYNCGL
jgi:hypothetical protein